MKLIAVFTLFSTLIPTTALSTWKNEFSDPYIKVCDEVTNMACSSANSCYINCINQGGGPGVFHWDGQPNKQPSGPMPNESGIEDLIIDLVVRNESGKEYGALGGMGVGKDFQWLKPSSVPGKGTWEASKMPFELILLSQAMTASPDYLEDHLIVALGQGPFINGTDEWGFFISNDDGQSFSELSVSWYPPQEQPCAIQFNYLSITTESSPVEGSIRADDVWFMTAGIAADEAITQKVEAKYLKSEEHVIARHGHGQILLVRNSRTGETRNVIKTPLEWRQDIREMKNLEGDDSCPWRGWFLRSDDQGKTWTEVGTTKPDAFPVNIACKNATSCVANAFDGNDNYIYALDPQSNGEFSLRYTAPPMTAQSATVFQAVACDPSSEEMWVAGAIQDSEKFSAHSEFWYSSDAGVTFQHFEEASVNDSAVIMAMDFRLAGDGSGRATGNALTYMTSGKASILSYGRD